MRNATASAAKKTDNERILSSNSRGIALHLCYGRIGISAVAAAARYQGSSKNPAYAPAVLKRNATTLT